MSDTRFIQFMVMELVGGKYESLGLQQFLVPPRMNEYITRDVNGIGQMYKIIAVIHPLEPAGTAGDLIIERLGTDIEIRNLLAGG
jgi:hypothetical protein